MRLPLRHIERLHCGIYRNVKPQAKKAGARGKKGGEKNRSGNGKKNAGKKVPRQRPGNRTKFKHPLRNFMDICRAVFNTLDAVPWAMMERPAPSHMAAPIRRTCELIRKWNEGVRRYRRREGFGKSDFKYVCGTGGARVLLKSHPDVPPCYHYSDR